MVSIRNLVKDFNGNFKEKTDADVIDLIEEQIKSVI